MTNHEIIKDIQQILKENERMEDVRKSYAEQAAHLRSHIAELEGYLAKLRKIADTIDPYGAAMEKTRSARTDYTEICQVFLDKLFAGTEVTISLVRNTYPELPPERVDYVMLKLQKTHGVNVRKDDGKRILYVDSVNRVTRTEKMAQ